MKRFTIIDLLAITVLALIPLFGFIIRNGISIIPAITELNVSPSFFLSNLLYSWHPYYAAGFDNSQSSWFIFPLGLLFTILNIFISVEAISLFFTFLVYFLHGVSMYFLMSVIGNTNGSLPRFSKIIASSLYMFNPFTLLYMHELGSQQLLASAILPFMLALVIQGFFRRKFSYCIGVGLVSVLAGANITFFVINILVLFVYLIYDLIVSRGSNFLWKSCFIATMLAAIFASNAYWLLPRISNLTTELGAAFRGGESIGGSLILNSMSSSYPETFRLMGSWAFQPLYFSFYHSYSSPIIIAATFASPLIAMLTLLLRPKKKLELFFATLAIICIPLAVAAYPISNPSTLGNIYIWLYQNVPFFIVFRGAYKFVMVIALSYAILVGLAYSKIVKANSLEVRKICLKSWKKRVLKLAFLGLILFLLLGSWPSFLGLIVEDEKNFNIPQYYYEAEAWLDEQKGNFRIMTIPEMRHVQYLWDGETKFTGTDVSIPIFRIPIIGRSYYLPLGSPNTDEVTHMFYRMIMANQTLAIADALNFLNVKYIMIHGDYKWSALEWNISPSQLFKILEKTLNIAFVKSFGKLYFFQNLKWVDSTAYIINGASGSQLSLFTSMTSDFDPEINQNNSNWKIENDMLCSNSRYNYLDDVVLSKNGYTNILLTFDAKSSDSYIHIYFFAKDKQNAYRLWLNSSAYELGKLDEGKYVVMSVQKHGFLFNLSSWNLYQLEVRETGIKITLNSDSFVINYENMEYVAGKVGFASTANNLWIKSIELQYQSIGIDSIESHVSHYVERDPTKYIVSLHNISKPIILVLTESFHEGWYAYMDEGEYSEAGHVKVLDYANGWYINRTGEFSVTLEYTPQRNYDLGSKVTFITFLVCLTYLTYNYAKNKNIWKQITAISYRNRITAENNRLKYP